MTEQPPADTGPGGHATARPTVLSTAAIWLLGALSIAVLRLARATWRKDTRGLDRLRRMQTENAPAIVAFWHGTYLPLFALGEGLGATVLTSASFRGLVISRICAAFGYRPQLVGGGHAGSVRVAVKKALEDGRSFVAIAVDGPLGPRHDVKTGVIILAADIGLDLVPLRVDVSHKLVLRSRWDQMVVPLPFAKVSVSTGEIIHLPDRLDTATLQEVRGQLTRELGDEDQRGA